MPNTTHKSLMRVLLWWVTVLSISQVVLLVLFFTVGRSGQSHNGAGLEGTNQSQGPRGQWSPSEPGVSSGNTRMFTFVASGVHSNRSITLYAVNPKNLPTDEGQLGIVKVNEDGYFFMCLQITMVECSKDNRTEMDRVHLMKDNKSILLGWINYKTCSTGVLCKMKKLNMGEELKVEIQTKHSSTSKLSVNESLSYLDVIYVPSKTV